MNEYVADSPKRRRRRMTTDVVPAQTKKAPSRDVAVERFESKVGRKALPTEITVVRYKHRANTPLKAIRAHCVECMGGSIKEVALCTAVDCALHPMRQGSNQYVTQRRRRDNSDKT